MLYINVNSIFFKSYSVDPISGHSIYVFDSTYLPAPEEVGDKQVYDLLVDELMDKLVTKLPSAPFSLVVFSSGFSQNKISWVYGIKMFSKLPKELRGFLQKTYIVHESFFVRTVYQVLSNAMNFKILSSNTLHDTKDLESSDSVSQQPSMVHVSDLTQLSHLIDITRLRISLNVYLYDYQFNDCIDVPQEYFTELSPLGTRQYRQLIFDKIFKRLKLEAVKNELVFQKPGTYKKVNILLDIIARNNYIDLSQWDIYSLASVFLHFLKNKSQPLIPIDMIPLPITDDFQYTYTTFCNIVKQNQYYDLLEAIFPLFMSMLDASEVTKHNTKTLSKALGPTLCKEKVSIMSSDRLAVGTRFIRNLCVHYNAIVDRIDRARTGRTRAISPINQTFVTSQPHQSSEQHNVSFTTTAITAPPPIPKARKASPTKYGNLDISDSSRHNSPIRATSGLSDYQKNARCTSSSSTLFGDNAITPILKAREPSISIRINSDSTATLSDETTDSRSGSPTRTPDAIKLMVADEVEKDVSDEDLQPTTKISADVNHLTLEKNDRIIQFDKDLRKQKKMNEKTGTNDKFSVEGYSDIKANNKVSKLAALYEERLQGLQVMNDIKIHEGYR